LNHTFSMRPPLTTLFTVSFVVFVLRQDLAL
jgi:hypothetical protein